MGDIFIWTTMAHLEKFSHRSPVHDFLRIIKSASGYTVSEGKAGPVPADTLWDLPILAHCFGMKET